MVAAARTLSPPDSPNLDHGMMTIGNAKTDCRGAEFKAKMPHLLDEVRQSRKENRDHQAWPGGGRGSWPVDEELPPIFGPDAGIR